MNLPRLKSFHKQACALRIMPDDFDQIRATPPEAEQVPAQRILFQDLLNLQRQARKAAAHIRVARRKPDPNAGGNGDHRDRRPSLSARSAAANVAPSIAPVTRIRAPFGKIDLDRAGIGRRGQFRRWGLRLRRYGRWHKSSLRFRRLSLRRSKRAPPFVQLPPRDAIAGAPSPRPGPRRLKALEHDLELLVLRPATPSAGLDDLQALNLSTVLMDVHTHCLLQIRHSRKDGRPRRDTTDT